MASRRAHPFVLISEQFLATVPSAHLAAASMYDQHLSLRHRRPLHTVTFFSLPNSKKSQKELVAVLHEERDVPLLHLLSELSRAKLLELQRRSATESKKQSRPRPLNPRRKRK